MNLVHHLWNTIHVEDSTFSLYNSWKAGCLVTSMRRILHHIMVHKITLVVQSTIKFFFAPFICFFLDTCLSFYFYCQVSYLFALISSYKFMIAGLFNSLNLVNKSHHNLIPKIGRETPKNYDYNEKITSNFDIQM